MTWSICPLFCFNSFERSMHSNQTLSLVCSCLTRKLIWMSWNSFPWLQSQISRRTITKRRIHAIRSKQEIMTTTFILQGQTYQITRDPPSGVWSQVEVQETQTHFGCLASECVFDRIGRWEGDCHCLIMVTEQKSPVPYLQKHSFSLFSSNTSTSLPLFCSLLKIKKQ